MVTSDEREIADICQIDGRAMDEARLIAAAPQLLAALEDACNLLIHAAAWFEFSKQEPIGKGLRQWVAETGNTAIAAAKKEG
jgi:hypothetical protein